jgi:GNAT superfamily N-acetyltransferase
MHSVRRLWFRAVTWMFARAVLLTFDTVLAAHYVPAREASRLALLVRLREAFGVCAILGDRTRAIAVVTREERELLAWVEPGEHRRGLGTMVSRKVIREAFEAGVDDLWVRVRRGSGGERLARRLGFADGRPDGEHLVLTLNRPRSS